VVRDLAAERGTCAQGRRLIRSPRHADLFVSALIGVLLQQLAVPRRNFRREAKATLLELVRNLTAKK